MSHLLTSKTLQDCGLHTVGKTKKHQGKFIKILARVAIEFFKPKKKNTHDKEKGISSSRTASYIFYYTAA
jgi:hypothetical protein